MAAKTIRILGGESENKKSHKMSRKGLISPRYDSLSPSLDHPDAAWGLLHHLRSFVHPHVGVVKLIMSTQLEVADKMGKEEEGGGDCIAAAWTEEEDRRDRVGGQISIKFLRRNEITRSRRLIDIWGFVLSPEESSSSFLVNENAANSISWTAASLEWP